MPVTIKVNGVANSLAHKGSNGVSAATIPDVCKTPSPGGPVPIPYPNVSQSATLAKGTTTVKADGGMMIANQGSEFSISNGDNPGVAGGVKSSTFMKESTWITYSFDVKMEGKGAARLTDKKFQNHENTVDLAGLIQKLLNMGMSLEDACKKLMERIDDLIGEGRTGKTNGIRGLEERFKQNTSGGSLGPVGAPDAPPDRPDGTNSWERHDKEIERQQQDLQNKIDEYDDKCGGKGPPVTQKQRDWADPNKKKRPVKSDWTGPLFNPPAPVPVVAPRSSSGLSPLAKGLIVTGLVIAGIALALPSGGTSAAAAATAVVLVVGGATVANPGGGGTAPSGA